MKIKTLAFVITSTLALTSSAVSAATTVNGGTVHFKGELVNAACAVDAGSVEQTVQLGQVRTAKLAKAEDSSESVSFSIKLNDCDSSVSGSAKVAFTGVAVSSTYPNWLSVASSAAGGATNVGIEILDYAGKTVGINGSTFSTAVTLKDGSNTLPFHARYRATGASTAGVANADATFAVQYE